MNTIVENKKYNKQLYKSGPVSFNEYITDKYDNIHKQLYNNALNKFIEDLIKDLKQYNDEVNFNDIYNNFKFIEVKNDEYWKPSDVIIIALTNNYNLYLSKGHKHRIDLSKYWDNYRNKTNDEIQYIKKTYEQLHDPEIIYLDYIKGLATITSRVDDITINVPFSFINENTKISEDYGINNTFLYKYNRL